jgi:hypothetical protein
VDRREEGAVIGHLIEHWLGMDNLSGPVYGFWSGFGSDVSEVALIGAVFGIFRRHNCHERHCWRIGRHVVDGTPWCDRHHLAARGGDGG